MKIYYFVSQLKSIRVRGGGREKEGEGTKGEGEEGRIIEELSCVFG